ncbi:hypothetical protein CUMW_256510, partial [Citrus unshiu]
MEILSGIASKLGELLVDATVKQARYLFCFNSIVKELEDKETNLKEAQDGINEKVEEERQKHCAIVVENDVEKWLADVVKEMADVRTLKANLDEKKSCFNGWCPNWGCRYWMDKELPIPRHFMSFGTTESACNQIIEALKGDNTKIVGLYGIGGVGKTTLANFVGNQLREENVFDEVGIATVSQDQNIINVQSELVKSLGWELTETYEKDRARRLRMMFSESKSRKMLIILDDVWNELDLEKVGIPVGDRDNCCKILLTTRLQPVCDRMGCDTQIQLGVLKQDEGLDLLRKHAGIDVADTTLIDVSKQVADECKGLLLAIKAVGSALRGRTADEWNRGIGGFGGNTQNNLGNGSNGGNNMPFKPNIVCQICFIPGHGATKCKNMYNSAFVPQRGPGRGNFRPVFNQYGRGFNQNNAGQRPFNNFGRGGNGAFSGNCAFSKGFGYQGYQGHTAYPEPTQSDHVVGIPFGSFHSGPSNPAAFNCYNG